MNNFKLAFDSIGRQMSILSGEQAKVAAEEAENRSATCTKCGEDVKGEEDSMCGNCA